MKSPKRTVKVKLDGDYKGFECEVLTSFPIQVFAFFQSRDFNLIQVGLKQILVSWNFTDGEGNPLPQPTETVPVLDALGKPMVEVTRILDGDGKWTGDTELTPVEVSAVSLVPFSMVDRLIEKIAVAITDVPTP